MISPLSKELINITKLEFSDNETLKRFSLRIKTGKLTRDENEESHFCVFFLLFDAAAQEVFIGDHKKSGLWLFTGGHIDPGELPNDTAKREAIEELGIFQIFWRSLHLLRLLKLIILKSNHAKGILIFGIL